ncbi:hypothetical protein [Tunicatimonas pelagia]|uniref:hypothetical protein n=1 Tax=Tunicatimonas pelagia TaxID=931531 RepID=UPI00266555BD|nr:hypothetical protein [Tunicatimonas pelagia]WKN42535.1 hypothetical protein P0M28_26215 [Tunicatimonas pelagia]
MRRTDWKLIIGLIILISSCDKEWEGKRYTEEPTIQLIDVDWKRYYQGSQRSSSRDSIEITIAWQDGNSDLGMSYRDSDTSSLYAPFELVRDDEGQPVYFDSETDIYNCRDFAFPIGLSPLIIGSDTITDTVRVIRNKYVANFHISVLYEDEGEFVERDFMAEYCRFPLGGRFPRISPLTTETTVVNDGSPFTIVQESPWSGIMTFTIFTSITEESRDNHPFAKGPLKFRVHINDRALNESNIVESEPISPRPIGW